MFISSSAPPAQIAVAVLHKDPLVRAGLTFILATEKDFDVSVVDRCASTADVVVADYDTALAFFDGDRAGAAGERTTHRPRVMVVSHRDGEFEIRHALSLGVNGYLLLDCGLDDMISGVRALHRGQRHLDRTAAQRVLESLHHESLTAREGDVLRLIAEGLLNKTIAGKLNISLGTVKAHVKAILAKLGAKTRTEAAAVAQRRGLLNGARLAVSS
ncbi:LuxR C-terminal-related transcriptional regulator [Variovorax sp. RHLX14]|uniref:LuxR C-terminal-related transcriptional regulator n=1 Tax=Variovorax sp. RHLX14 TaxID=1259731 RepID=UPI003F470521